MMDRNADIPLIIFAKAPIPGKVKTRMQPHLSTHQSAELAQLLLEITVQNAAQYWPGEIVLSAGLDVKHAFLVDLSKQYNLRIEPQTAGDLGQRMSNAMQQYGYPAAIVGSDIPQIDERILKSAYAHLSCGENVLGPCDDGGYYLIGLAQAAAELFKEIAWGSRDVLHQTLQKARLMQLSLQQLAPINDIDTWDDLNKAADSVSQLSRYLARLKRP